MMAASRFSSHDDRETVSMGVSSRLLSPREEVNQMRSSREFSIPTSEALVPSLLQRTTAAKNEKLQGEGDGILVRNLATPIESLEQKLMELEQSIKDHNSSTDRDDELEVCDMGDASGNSSEAEMSQPVHDERIHAGSGALGLFAQRQKDEMFKKVVNGSLDLSRVRSMTAFDIHDDESESSEDEDETKWEFPEGKLSEEDRNYGVDARDVGTSDSWLKRHPSLIRLTGRHPFNCEAPLPKLMEQGFLTPTNLHYVRNHGYVPRGVWDEWTIEVGGRVRRPMTLTMKDLLTKFPQRTLPVTLVCAGNRRMEQNLTSQTIGFNWGAAGVSTSVWRGVRLCDVLRYCGVSKKMGAAYVCFEGAENLPGGGGNKYGTSISMDTAMDPAKEALIAFQQNGKVLDPDHGYPVRIILPGHIGGRMVKWLKKIEATPQESNNYYHFHDNRVLPSHLDAETSKAEGWWHKPDFIINELNINSAITTPAHDEVLPFEAAQRPYKVKGYAYTGGGRKIIRVEVSLDSGTTWRLCDVSYGEKPTEYGKYWCWVHWHLEVDVTDFLQSKELAVRAWDSSMNTQSQNLTWNVMGMMNNCWFRVKVNACKTNSGGIGLNFQHPTVPGKQPGGWMYTEKAAKSVQEAPKAQATMHKSSSTPSLAAKALPQISMSEVRRHTDSQSAWIVYDDAVYDCTPFLKDHPGGADSILLTAGTDATEEFDGIHSEKAKVMLEKYKVGMLAPESSEPPSEHSTPDSSLRGGNNFGALASVPETRAVESSSNSPPIALNPRERINFHLIEKEILSSDVRKLRFALQSEKHVMGLPVGKHILVAGRVDQKLVMRAYTPTTCDKDVGHFDLLVKVYYKSQQFPVGGLMSQFLDSLKIGETIGVKGPIGHIHYKGKGSFSVDNNTKFAKEFAMIAGGTGITPMYQVIRAILEDPEDQTRISLIYCNRTENDIMLKDELDKWQETHSNFKVYYTLSGKPREGWAHGRTRITEQMMREHLPIGGSSDTFAFLCGPLSLEAVCKDTFEKMGYDKENCMSF